LTGAVTKSHGPHEKEETLTRDNALCTKLRIPGKDFNLRLPEEAVDVGEFWMDFS
jgi:hypothetical protein